MFPILNLLPPPSPYHPSGLSQCTSPKHPVSCIEPGLVTRFIYDSIRISMPFSQIIPSSPSPTESKRLFYTSVSLLLSRIQGYCYHLSKFHIYVLVYWKRSVFIPIPKKGNAKECSNYRTIALISHASKLMLKILQARLQQYMNRELPDVQAGFRKGRRTRDQIANIHWIME